MLTNFNDIKNDVIVKLGISTTSAYYTDAILDDWVQQAERWATSYRKWPFSEGKIETTYTSAKETWSFEGIKADSIRILQIGGKRFEKVTFEDYQIFKEEETSGSDKIFSDFGRELYVNTNTDASGTLVGWGQFAPIAIDPTEPTAETIFSNGDEEGNTAIVEEVLYYANLREEKMQQAEIHHVRATQILDNVFKNYLDEQFNYKTYKTRGGMFKRVDVVEGDLRDDLFKRDQF